MKIINFQLLTINELVLFASLSVVFIIRIFYLLNYYLRVARHKDHPEDPNPNPITIILSLRNEEDRIRKIVTKMNDLQFDNYQILVVNEFSEDNTLEILNVLAETNPKLKVTSLSQETRFSDKQAINLGLKGASSPWIVFLTSNSSTIHPEWLSGMNKLMEQETDAVIAYTNVERSKGFRNLLCRLERFNQFVISGGWLLAGQPFVYNQHNVLFRKSMYFETLGFRQKLDRNFANLELIFNENFRKGRVKISTNPELAIREKIEDDRGDHIKLIKKGVQIRQSLSIFRKLTLFIDDMTRILLPVLSIVLIVLLPEYWLTIISLPLISLFLLSASIKMLLNRLKERKIFLTSLVYIFIKPLINWWFFWTLYLIHRRNKWN